MEAVAEDASADETELLAASSLGERDRKPTKWDRVVTALEKKYFQDDASSPRLYPRVRRILRVKEAARAFSSQRAPRVDVSEHGSSLKVHPPTRPLTPLEATSARNPYQSFLRRSRQRAAIWRPLLPTIIGPGASGLVHHPDSTLSQKADAVTAAITSEFCAWARTLDGDGDRSGVSEEQLAQLFEVGFSDPVARAVRVSVRHLPVVARDVARALRVPQADARSALMRELSRDLRAEAVATRTVAFGRTLPPELRRRPAATDVRATWLGAERRPPPAAGVWTGDVARLRTTKAFVKFLKEHPEEPRPQTLVEAGFFDGKDEVTGSAIISDSEGESVEIEYSIFAADNEGVSDLNKGNFGTDTREESPRKEN